MDLQERAIRPPRPRGRRRPGGARRALRRRVLALSPEEASFARRGFDLAAPARAQLERDGGYFVAGFNTGLETDDAQDLARRLDAVPLDGRGFAFEGAGMSWAILDILGRGHRVPALLDGPGHPWRYLVHVGSGWAMARLAGLRPAWWGQVDPLLRWLALDGWGFHDGYFKPRRTIARQRRPARLGADERRLYDQGLGRSLWFVAGADVARVARLIAAFAPQRRDDLYAGVGLAATYAGGVPGAALDALRDGAGEHRVALAQGSAFAAKARLHAGNHTDVTASATERLSGLDLEAAAACTDAAIAGLREPFDAAEYERWRVATRHHLTTLRQR